MRWYMRNFRGGCTDVYTPVYTLPHLENVVRKTAEGAEETPYYATAAPPRIYIRRCGGGSGFGN